MDTPEESGPNRKDKAEAFNTLYAQKAVLQYLEDQEKARANEKIIPLARDDIETKIQIALAAVKQEDMRKSVERGDFSEVAPLLPEEVLKLLDLATTLKGPENKPREALGALQRAEGLAIAYKLSGTDSEKADVLLGKVLEKPKFLGFAPQVLKTFQAPPTAKAA